MKYLKRIVFISTCLWVVLAAPILAAADQPTSTNMKIGVVDWQQLYAKSPQAEAAGKRLEKEFQDRQEKLATKQKEMQTKYDKWQRDREILSEADRTKLEKELGKLQQELRRMEEEFRADKTARHLEEKDDFERLVQEVIEKLGTSEKYDLILTQETTSFSANRLDVTEEVLKQLAKAPKDAKSKK